MKNFSRGGGFNDRKSSGGFGHRDSGSRGFNRGASDRPAMHKATCAECGNACEVPFKPSGDRPVLCSNCFKGKDGGKSDRSHGRDFSRPNFSEKRLFKATCAECGNTCEVPFQPSSGKPVYCSNCFGKNDKGKSNGSNSSNEQFEILNAKLDKILRALQVTTVVEPVVKKEKVQEVKAVEVKAIAKKVIKKVAPKKVVAAKKNKKK